MSDEGNYIMMYTYCSILAMVTILTKMLYLEKKNCLGKRCKHVDNLLFLNVS